VRAHLVRASYRTSRPYADNSQADWIEEAWFILECQVCHHVQFATRWFGSVEQPCSPPDDPLPLPFYAWTGYVAGEGWEQWGDEIDE
jgi:hypothetical protein